MTNTEIKDCLDKMHLSDIYSLILFILYKIEEIPEYAVTSELCYLLDGNSLTRLLTFFAGKTITIPTADKIAEVTNALLLYQFINIEKKTFVQAQELLGDLSVKQREKAVALYLDIVQNKLLKDYNINRENMNKI